MNRLTLYLFLFLSPLLCAMHAPEAISLDIPPEDTIEYRGSEAWNAARFNHSELDESAVSSLSLVMNLASDSESFRDETSLQRRFAGKVSA